MIDTPEEATRLARAILSDIRVYNEQKIRKGIEDDTVLDLLAEEIEEGRRHYRSRISLSLAGRTNYYNLAIVDVLIYQSRNVRSKIW
ncbi:MAG: hypothetical protein Q8R92_04410 [Deltaproteobacteria bacterium]|nr:hypothetical protein [Deltaproteobacteria bacterium]